MADQLKIVIAGDRGVGKTKLFTAWSTGGVLPPGSKIYDTFRAFTKDVDHDGKKISVVFYDTPTEDRVRLRTLNYPNCNCVILIFAVDNPDTFKYITKAPPEDEKISARSLIEEVQDVIPTAPIVLLGCKTDLERQVTKEQAMELQNTIKAVRYMEVNHNDWDSMEALLQECVGLAVKHDKTVEKEKVPLKQSVQASNNLNASVHPTGGGGGGGGGKGCCVIL